MELKLFISFASEDNNKMEALFRALQKIGPPIYPIVVAKTNRPGKLLADKVNEGIQESQFFIPILTNNSIANQWVNQEIGFAYSHSRMILPIIDQNIMSKLKGFINPQLDLPFYFESDSTNWRREAHQFRNCYKKLIDFLKERALNIVYDSEISPSVVRQGESYTTKVKFKGIVENGFFDIFVKHQDSDWKKWNWDNSTLKNLVPTNGGELHGEVEVEKKYTWSTEYWPVGKYKIYTRLYDHLIIGARGRFYLAEKVHNFEVQLLCQQAANQKLQLTGTADFFRQISE
ncbi:MAG: toll/interleukin-1 receptor domain-containing protein [Bacteroidales bacterium]|nr:toll/interleukin-1 receptor domain-containing protein [Bacteroidales bacterium]